MMELKYAELLAANEELGKTLTAPPYRVAVLSNIIVHQLNEVLEYALRLCGINAVVESGDYDNVSQDAERFADRDLLVVFYETANIVDGFQWKAAISEDALVEGLIDRVRNELELLFASAKSVPLILVNSFSALAFTSGELRAGRLEQVTARLNDALRKMLPKNAIIVDLDRLFAKVSLDRALDLRNFYSSKALYTVELFKHYAEQVVPAIAAVRGKAKKVLVFDCDNTLWKGVLGEDGFDGIEMSPQTPAGAAFQEVQGIAVELAKRGVLICLCSKNNPEDVDAVLEKHPDMILRDEHITAKKVNWIDKAASIRELARELNLGLDSFVFVDDTDFEVNYIRESVPEVTVLQVPAKAHLYPSFLRSKLGLFFTSSESAEDARRTALYKEEQLREKERSKFESLEEYLASLELRLRVRVDEPGTVARAAQLTQKTNQFNLTTRRYSEQEVAELSASDRSALFTFDVRDKYGDYGQTGLAIVRLDHGKRSAEIDTLLMSCRVIGRRLEHAFLRFVLRELKEQGIESVYAEFIPTPKNAQVAHFYDQAGFAIVEEGSTAKRYRGDLKTLDTANIEFIEIEDGRTSSKSNGICAQGAGVYD